MNKEYILTFNPDVSGSSFTASTGSQVLSNNATTSVGTITALSYEKKIYAPCRIDAEIQPSGSSTTTEEIITKYHKQTVQLAVKNGDTETVILKNCFVYQVIPHYRSSDASLTVGLVIYSMDKLFDIKKVCRSYVGQRLGNDIIASAVNEYQVSEQLKVTHDVSNMQFLCYGVSVTAKEFIQPHLLQYKETLYNMLARTANRCGEFLYFENGTLILGHKKQNSSTVSAVVQSTESTGNLVLSDAVCASKEYDPFSGKEFLFNRNPTSDSDTGAEEGQTFIQPFSTAHDEYSTVIEKDGFAEFAKCAPYAKTLAGCAGSFNNHGGKKNWALLIYFLNKLFRSTTTAAETITNFVIDEAEGEASAAIAMGETNDFFNKHFLKDGNLRNEYGPNGNASEYATDKDNGKYGMYTTYPEQKTNVNGTDQVGLKSDYYKEIYKIETAIAEEKVIMTVTTSVNEKVVYLGDHVTVEGKTYIITETRGSYDDNGWKEEFVGVPLLDSVAVPPVCPQGHTCKAERQLAKVADNVDPDHLGRVRVKYLWQENEKQDEYKKPTPYIRVATPYTGGGGGGMFFQPKVDDEVLIDYDQGDGESPYVCASVYNKKILPPLGPQSSENAAIIRSRNGHSINFIDDDDESAYVSSLFKSPVVAQVIGSAIDEVAGATQSDKFNKLEDRDPNRTAGSVVITDVMGVYKIEASASDRAVNVSSPWGTVKIDAFTGISIEAPQGDIKIVGKNVSIEARNNLTLKSGIAIKDALDKKNVSFTSQMAAAAGKKVAELFCMDLSWMRCIYERFSPPVEGTMLIKSHHYLALEAGDGQTELGFANDNKKVVKINQLVEQAINSAKSKSTAIIDTFRKILQNITKSTTSLKNTIKGASAKEFAWNTILTDEKEPSVEDIFEWCKTADGELGESQITGGLNFIVFKADEEANANPNQRIELLKKQKELRTRILQLFSSIKSLQKQLSNANSVIISQAFAGNNNRVINIEGDEEDQANAIDQVDNSIINDLKDNIQKHFSYDKIKAAINLCTKLEKFFTRKIINEILNSRDLENMVKYDKDTAEECYKTLAPQKGNAPKISDSLLDSISDALMPEVPVINYSFEQKLTDEQMTNGAIWYAWASGWSTKTKAKDASDSFYDALTNAFRDNYPTGWGAKEDIDTWNAANRGTILISSSASYILREENGKFTLDLTGTGNQLAKLIQAN